MKDGTATISKPYQTNSEHITLNTKYRLRLRKYGPYDVPFDSKEIDKEHNDKHEAYIGGFTDKGLKLLHALTNVKGLEGFSFFDMYSVNIQKATAYSWDELEQAILSIAGEVEKKTIYDYVSSKCNHCGCEL
jgi:hypothetical protein